TLCLALMQIVYGPLTDTWGRRNVLLPGIALYVLASVGCAFAPTIGWFLGFRALQAIGIATGSVVATTVIGDLFEGRERGRAMGTFQMCVSLGPVLGPLIGGVIGGVTDSTGVFFVLAGVAVLMLGMNLRFLPETKPEVAGGNRFSLRDFATVLRHPVGLGIVVLAFVQYYTFYNYLVFMPTVLTDEYGLSASEKGFVFLPLSIMIVIGSFLGGRLQERFHPRRYMVVIALVNVLAVLLFPFAAAWALPALIGATTLFGLCLGLSLPVQTTLLTGAFQRERGTAVGVYNFFRYLGMAAGPMLGSFLFHLGRLPVLFGFATVLGALTTLFLRRQLGFNRIDRLQE
ncbi:MAG TPA: MFS transporter, partial [Bacilli bacterium]|nr:MFS transporter [Bacilli bacterium]